MFRPIRIRAESAIFYPRNTPSMIVNNIPSSTVVQMAAFKFGDRLFRVEDCHRANAEVRRRDRTELPLDSYARVFEGASEMLNSALD